MHERTSLRHMLFTKLEVRTVAQSLDCSNSHWRTRVGFGLDLDNESSSVNVSGLDLDWI